MSNFLTIPTEIRIKILDCAISDVTVQELTPAAHSNSWVLGRFNNPNLAMGMVCRQLHTESMSQRGPKPIMTIRGSWCDKHSNYCVLKDVPVLRVVTQFSALRFEDVVVPESEWLQPWSLLNSDIRAMVKCVMERRLTWYGCDVEVTSPEPGDANQRGNNVIVSVVVKPH